MQSMTAKNGTVISEDDLFRDAKRSEPRTIRVKRFNGRQAIALVVHQVGKPWKANREARMDIDRLASREFVRVTEEELAAAVAGTSWEVAVS